MVTMFNPKPQLLRAVDKPANVSSQEIANARPVYIDGLPEGGTDIIADVERFADKVVDLEARVVSIYDFINNFESRIAALENPAG